MGRGARNWWHSRDKEVPDPPSRPGPETAVPSGTQFLRPQFPQLSVGVPSFVSRGGLGTTAGTTGITPTAVPKEGGVARPSPGPQAAVRGGRRRTSAHPLKTGQGRAPDRRPARKPGALGPVGSQKQSSY